MDDISWTTVLVVALTQAATLAGVWLTGRHQWRLERMKIDEARRDARTTRMLDAIGTARLMKLELELARAAFSDAWRRGFRWSDTGVPPTDLWRAEGRVLARIASAEQWAAITVAYNRIEVVEKAEIATEKHPGSALAWKGEVQRTNELTEGIRKLAAAIAALDEIIEAVDAGLTSISDRAGSGL